MFSFSDSNNLNSIIVDISFEMPLCSIRLNFPNDFLKIFRHHYVLQFQYLNTFRDFNSSSCYFIHDVKFQFAIYEHMFGLILTKFSGILRYKRIT